MFRPFFSKALPVAFLALAGLARAAEPFGVEEAVAEALRRNPDLLALRARASARDERSDRETALPPPTLTYGSLNGGDSARLADGDETRLALTQELPGFGKRAVRGRLADTEAALLWVELRVLENETAFRVRRLAWALAETRASLLLLRDATSLDRLAELAGRRDAGGPAAGALRVEAERALRLRRVLSLESREKTLLAELGLLLHRPPEDPPPVPAVSAPVFETPDPGALLRKALDIRPEYAAARLRVERAAYGVRRASKEAWPDFRVGAEKRYDRDGDRLLLSGGLTLPIWRKGLRAAAREAGWEAEAAEADLESELRDSRFRIEEACLAYDSARRTLALSRGTLVPGAEKALAAASEAYAAGSLPLADLLERERFLLDVRLSAAGLEAETGVAAARLERLLGFSPAPP